MPKARYEGIYRELRDRIQGGLYAYRDLLPTENELTTEFSCSRNTLRRALSMLADEAFVQPIHGKGVRVIWREETHNVTGVLEGIESFGEYAARNGLVPSTHVELVETVTCDKALAVRSGFEIGDLLKHVVRVRSLNGRACQIDRGYFLESVAPGITGEVAGNSIYRHLEQEVGVKILTSRRAVTVELADEEDRDRLDLGPYGCVAVIEGRSFNSDGIMFEYTRSRIHPEIFRYQLTSKR